MGNELEVLIEQAIDAIMRAHDQAILFERAHGSAEKLLNAAEKLVEILPSIKPHKK